jgi:hypothetical protein
MGRAAPGDYSHFFPNVEKLMAGFRGNQKGVTLFHFVIVVIFGEVAQHMPLNTEEYFVSFSVAAIQTADFAWLQNGHAESDFLGGEILPNKLILIHSGNRVFQMDNFATLHRLLFTSFRMDFSVTGQITISMQLFETRCAQLNTNE